MEDDDDEFGDLYTDVLRPSNSTPAFASNPSSVPKLPLKYSPPSDDDEDILYAPPNPNLPLPSSHSTPPSQTLESTRNESDTSAAPQHHPNQVSPLLTSEDKEPPRVSNSPIPGSPQDDGIRVSDDSAAAQHHLNQSSPVPVTDEKHAARVSDTPPLPPLGLPQDGGTGASEIDVGIGDLDSDLIIPGLSTGPSIPGIFDGSVGNGDAKGSSRKDDSGGGGGGGDDDWDSDDSEDDIQIVLNDNSGPIGLERNDDEDEDGEDFVIVADGDQHRPEIEDQDWGEEAGQAVAEGERKEIGEAAKVNGGVMVAGGARIGYSGHGYHPHHSQFKYVRPGAAVSAAVGVGVPGQVRPPATMSLVAGRGRGDWRPIGVNKNIPIIPKPFHSGFVFPGWVNNSSGRNGLDFTLPSHKTVFDIHIDSFEEKPWRHPGVDTSDYFNFGLDEDNWKEYCKQLDQLRLEATMQSKIRVYESGRSEQDYDPDLPPELAAAAGLHDVNIENATLGKTDSGQADLMGQGRGASRMRPPLPTGRAIQVEGGSGERLPSIDTRQPRLRDSDAIIEIVLQDSVDDDSVTSNGTVDRPENGLQVDPRGGRDNEENGRPPESEYFDQFPPNYNGRKRELVPRRAPFVSSVHNNIQEGDGILPFPSEAPLQYHPGSKARGPIYPGGPFAAPQGGRWAQGTARERYSHTSGDHKNDIIPSQSARNRSEVRQSEKSGDSIDGKDTPEASSPAAVEAVRDPSLEQKDDMHDDEQLALADSVEGEEMGSDMGIPSETLADDSTLHTVKKQKLSSRVEQPAVLDVGNEDDLRTTLSDNSKAKSGSSRDYQKRHDGGEEEVMQDGRSRRIVDDKRRHEEDESVHRRREDYSRGSRHEMDRSRMVTKGREDPYNSYPYRDWDSGSSHYARARTDGFERAKERDNSVGAWQRRDEDAHGRRVKDDDIRRRERVEETGSRHRKLNENDRNDKDEHPHSRKRVDDGDWRGRHDKDGGPRPRERDDVLIGRHEILNDPHKRRKEEELPRREHVDKEDTLHGYRSREDSSRRKRERDDGLDQRRREDQARARDKPDDHHSVRHRDENWRLREREDRHRLKQPHEDTQTNRDREEGRGATRSGRASDDKQWAGNARAKDESKGLGSEKDYQLKDKRRQSEQPKRRDRVDEETSSQHRGRDDAYSRENQFGNEERNPRHERSSTQNDRSVSTSDNQRLSKERHKDNIRKSKESDGGDQSTLLPSKRKHDDHSTHRNEKTLDLMGISSSEGRVYLTLNL
ncbi:FIP1[V]-like protein isoform X2 [Magnolia sinica]|uniref:FIP1[V]-like protein isoform X2 n=1 Tax=Magnolia sinica TaxID=86752 RepID=UPI00265A7351|nr:FIP1[V]-like protein isoform X2 [Magnolia sinica]